LAAELDIESVSAWMLAVRGIYNSTLANEVTEGANAEAHIASVLVNDERRHCSGINLPSGVEEWLYRMH
jgi:hypothetical protein